MPSCRKRLDAASFPPRQKRCWENKYPGCQEQDGRAVHGIGRFTGGAEKIRSCDWFTAGMLATRESRSDLEFARTYRLSLHVCERRVRESLVTHAVTPRRRRHGQHEGDRQDGARLRGHG